MANQMTAAVESREANVNTYTSVMEAIGNLDIVRESHPPLNVTVEQGVVTLSGVALSRMMRHAMLRAAAMTPGVAKVVDKLVDDTQLRLAVANELAAEPSLRQHQPSMIVDSYAGMITLSSAKLSEADQAKAREVASRIAGAQGVIIK